MAVKARLHLRGEFDGHHTKITVFSNGANNGTLIMLPDEAVFFHHLFMMSSWAREGEVISTGTWCPDPEEERQSC